MRRRSTLDEKSDSCWPYVISIAGFDPSAGAGVLADIKCFEQHQVYGFGICSALTVQTDASFVSCQWMDAVEIIAQIAPLIDKFRVVCCKIGLIKNVSVLLKVVSFIKSKNQSIKIILDPVLSSSTGYTFHEWSIAGLKAVLQQLALITPNYLEMEKLGNGLDPDQTARLYSVYCPVLLKGGHNDRSPGMDILYMPGNVTEFESKVKHVCQKHGSGCVLSAAIAANLALGFLLEEACLRAKDYTADFLNSNSGLLGYHTLE